MRVLIACEFSGVVREAFRKKGHNAWSCDLLPALDESPNHYQRSVFEVLNGDWDLMIAHPPCTYLSVSGLHWNKNNPERQLETVKALEFVQELMDAPIEKICIENPVGCISTKIKKPSQIIQPYEYNEDASKRTCLWLKNLPNLVPTNRIEGRKVYQNGREYERWANQTDSGQNKLGPSEDRAMLRSITYQGIADAFADQWG